MTATLERLVAVRETRLQALRAELARRLGELATIDRELAAVDRQLDEIDAQHAAWEIQWQHWMREDGVLFRGRAYNTRHVVLNAWREEVAKRRLEVGNRRQAAQEQVALARTQVLQAQQRVELIQKEIATARKARRARSQNRAETSAMDDAACHGRTAAE